MITLKNKKGLTFSSLMWTFVFVTLFILALGVVSNEMNNLYGGSNDLTFGIVTNSTYTALQNYQSSLDSDLRGSDSGQAGYSTLGILTLTKLPKIIWGVMGMMIGFVTGGWIETPLMLLHLGSITIYVLVLFRVLFTVLVMFLIIKLLTRSPT